jgi:hypothetical protein
MPSTRALAFRSAQQVAASWVLEQDITIATVIVSEIFEFGGERGKVG